MFIKLLFVNANMNIAPWNQRKTFTCKVDKHAQVTANVVAIVFAAGVDLGLNRKMSPTFVYPHVI